MSERDVIRELSEKLHRHWQLRYADAVPPGAFEAAVREGIRYAAERVKKVRDGDHKHGGCRDSRDAELCGWCDLEAELRSVVERED